MFESLTAICGPASSRQMAKINYNVSFTNKEKSQKASLQHNKKKKN